jgi:hypothetical protein
MMAFGTMISPRRLLTPVVCVAEEEEDKEHEEHVVLALLTEW